ncbi:MAG TPA: hypothetical protein VIH90_07970 [Candidatus Saccharimonadales bacterium]
MAYEFLGLDVEVPFGPADGAINGPNMESIVHHIRQTLESPLEITRWGSVTFNGGEGNGPTYGQVYYHNKLTGQTVNSLGLPSVGIAVMESYFPGLLMEAEERGKTLIPGISPAKGEDPLSVLPEMAERLVEAGAKRIDVNYSCPNKVVEGGGREPILSHDIETMEEVDQAVVGRVGPDIWVIRKIAPLVGDKKALIPETAEYFSRVSGQVAISFNTVGGQSILTENGEPALDLPDNLGGLSGPATRVIGRSMLSEFRSRLPLSVQIDSPLGVDSGDEVYERTEVGGANFTSGVTLFIENEGRGIDYRQTGVQVTREFFDKKQAAFG